MPFWWCRFGVSIHIQRENWGTRILMMQSLLVSSTPAAGAAAAAATTTTTTTTATTASSPIPAPVPVPATPKS